MPPQQNQPEPASSVPPQQPTPQQDPFARPRPVYNPSPQPVAPVPVRPPAPVTPPPAPRPVASQMVPNAFPPPSAPSPVPSTPVFTGQQIPPQTPRSAFTSSYQAPRKSHGGLIAILVIILLLVAGAAYAYYEQLWVFARPPYDTTQLASSIFAGVGKINTSSYSFRLNVVSEPRDADAIPFSVAVSDDSAAEAYKRDQDKVRDLQNILRGLSSYYFLHKSYPSTLEPLGTDLSKLSKVVYVYAPAQGAADFTLTVQFESADAVSAIQASIKSYGSTSGTTIKGKSVVFSKKSSSYVYLPERMPGQGMFNLAGMQRSLSYIPSNFSLDGTISGASQKTDDGTINGKSRIAGTGSMGDFNASIDAEFRKVGETLFIMISKFPALPFFDLSKLKGKWIEFKPEDLATYGASLFGSDSKATQEKLAKTREKSARQIKLFLEVADEHQALLIDGSPVQDKIGETRTYRYELKFNKSTLKDFYVDLASRSKAELGEDGFKIEDSFIEYLSSPEFDQVFDYLRANTTLTVWADSQGIPVQSQYTIRLVPESNKKNADTQVRAAFTLTLSDINKPIVIEAPQGTMTIEDATIALTGQSKEQYLFGKQLSAINTLRNAITSYKSIVGSYPKSLSDLKKSRADLKKISTLTAEQQQQYYFTFQADDKPLLTELPVDVYSHAPFNYALNGTDYSLTYTVKLPPYEKGTMASSMYSMDYSGRMVGNTNYKLIIRAVEGTNTADSKNVSREAITQSAVDADADGLPDVLENYLGTNKLKKDTDGDGHSDYSEITNGTNPLGPGTLNRSSGSYF